MRSPNLTTLLITPNSAGWCVRDDGGRMPPSSYDSFEAAEQDAREYLERRGGGRLVVREGALVVSDVEVPVPG